MSKETTKGGAAGKSPGNKAKRKLTRDEKKQIAEELSFICIIRTIHGHNSILTTRYYNGQLTKNVLGVPKELTSI